MKNGILFAALALVLCVATDSYSLGRLSNIQQKLIVHSSGTTTVVIPKATEATPKKKRSTTRLLPRASSKTRSKKRSGSSISSFTVIGKSPGRRSSVSQQPGRDEDVEDLIDRLAGRENKEFLLVTAIGQEPYEAEEMLSGIDNELRIDTVGGRVHLPIDKIESILFGARDFNKLSVTVDLKNGGSVKGTIYQKYIFEFYANDALIPTFANQLSSVKVGSVGSR
jgi:hypothetical protein